MIGSSGPSLWVTVLAGGSGRRFWPLSRPDRPKQLLPLGSARPLVAATLDRVRRLAPPERTRILAGEHLVAPIREVTGLPPDAFLVEPRARGTGPVLAWAAWELARADPAAVMVSLHADHIVAPASSLRDAVRAAAEISVREDLLMTIAVPPDRPETGYGYLLPGAPLAAPAGHRAYGVRAFAEKPDAATAARYVADGYRWNSGIFVWPAATFLREVHAHAPGIARALPLLEEGRVGRFFDVVQPVSVDEGVLERSGQVGSLDATFAWDDMGTWEAFARHGRSDAGGNVAQGDVHLADARRNIAVAESGRVVVLGAHDLLVVRTDRETLVMPRARAPELKRYLSDLPARIVRSPSGEPGADRG